MAEEISNYLKRKFVDEFNLDYLIFDIMKMCDQKKLKEYIIKTFKENIDFEEYRSIFKELTEEQFENTMKELGFDYTYNRKCEMEDIMYKIYNNLSDSKKELNINNVEIYTNLENELSIRYQKDKTTYVITSVAVQNEEWEER